MRHSLRKSFVLALTVAAGGLGVAQAQDAAPQSGSTPSLEQYDAVLKDFYGLQTYNSLVERQLQNQQVQLDQLKQSIDQVPDLERQIPALLTKMVDSLSNFVELDLPFKLDERRDRVQKLKAMLENTDVSEAEKARRVLEAWTIESDYGRSYDATTEPLEIAGTVHPEVNILRIGRVALIYQTPDAKYTGAYDPRTRKWVELGSDYRNQVRQALRMAQHQVAPQLLLLPVTPPQAAQAAQQ